MIPPTWTSFRRSYHCFAAQSYSNHALAGTNCTTDALPLAGLKPSTKSTLNFPDRQTSNDSTHKNCLDLCFGHMATTKQPPTSKHGSTQPTKLSASGYKQTCTNNATSSPHWHEQLCINKHSKPSLTNQTHAYKHGPSADLATLINNSKQPKHKQPSIPLTSVCILDRNLSHPWATASIRDHVTQHQCGSSLYASGLDR